MPRQVAATVENNFRSGLITEASGLNYPENACVDTLNCTFDLVGRVQRRLGFDFESGFTTKTIDRTGAVISTYYWKNVTGDGTLSFVVQQVGATLYFYNINNAPNLSTGADANTITLSTFLPAGSTADPKLSACQFADGLGKLFVVHPSLEAFYVVYNSNDTFTATQINLQIRDTTGVATTAAPDFRPTATLATLTNVQLYNLLNQGWVQADKTTTSQLSAWDTARTDMPSNADIWWVYKNASLAFTPALANSFEMGNTPAPKGHYILNAFNQDRSAAAAGDQETGNVSGLAVVTSNLQRPSTNAFFAGRVWYSGVNATGFESRIYFSQIILPDRVDQFGMCYQKEDMTSETAFDLLDDDGGVIVIPEAGTIYKLFSMQSGLLVFGFRGVWMITGSTGIGFTAKDFSVTKISNYNAISATSFVEVNGAPIWWNNEGIFTVEGNANGITGGVTCKSLTRSTINAFYQAIPTLSKQTARGVYNTFTQEVCWLYKSTGSSTVQDSMEFDSVLVLNLLTGAFYPWQTSAASPVKIHGATVIFSQGAPAIEWTVIDGAAETVVDGAGDTVTVYTISTNLASATFKYFVSYPNAGSWLFTYAETRDANYRDWFSFDSVGVNYSSYLKTGYKLHGGGLKKFQPVYTMFYNQGTGAYTVQGIWDYALNTGTHRFTTPQTLNYTSNNVSNAHKKVKIRGQGLTLQYFIQSVNQQPFTIIGWTALEAANTVP